MEEHNFTTTLADFIIICIVNAERRRLETLEQEARAEKERIGAELSVASQIQASMLPCIFPPFPERAEFDIYASMNPAREVGGDFYDFFFIDRNTLAVVIADVSGKGVPAALFMVIAKTLIKSNAQNGKSPKEVFETVNKLLCENNESQMFVTVFMGYLDISSGKFTYVNAGHNPPLRCAGKHFDWLQTKPGLMLAFMETAVYREDEIILNPGDELFLYTDGITEAMNNEKELFTEERLGETINHCPDIPLKDFIVFLKREIDQFADGAEQTDDITMLALRYCDPGNAAAEP
jgi:sigma-B regulation protein RsbU (phosphoserine phosphatase)